MNFDYRDSLAQDDAGEEEKYTLVMANPPFAGSLDYESCAKDLQQVVKTKKTELLFLALFLRLLKPGGRAAVIVPDGVLFGSSNAHKTLRRVLVRCIHPAYPPRPVSKPSTRQRDYSGRVQRILGGKITRTLECPFANEKKVNHIPFWRTDSKWRRVIS